MAKLFVVEGGKTEVLEAQPFDNETLLQDILEKFPEVIALDDLGVSEPFIVIGREVATPAGSIDVLCIDGEGVLTVIETKLARNPQIRREVVGQILEYVGQVSKWRAQDVIQVASRYFQSESAPIEMRNRSLFDVLRGDAEPEGELLPDELYDRIDNNLRKGRVKIVIASDMIPETLKDTVTYC
jgi:Holliday junction resolvase-like predicted endonuclease